MKLVVVVRRDLRLSAGKVAAQVGHAVHGVLERAKRRGLSDQVAHWEDWGRKKVVLGVETGEELEKLAELVRSTSHFGQGPRACYLVRDAARTELAVPTMTCLGILTESNCALSGHLPLYVCPDLREAHELLKESLSDNSAPDLPERIKEYLRG